MEQPNTTELRVGDWRVSAKSGEISRGGETIRLEARTMRLLLCLAEHAGEVMSIDDLLDQVWAGVIVSQDSVYQAVASLRRQLGDDSKQPTYIETVPRLGYRMVTKVGPWTDAATGETEISEFPNGGNITPTGSRLSTGTETNRGRSFRAGFAWAIGGVICLGIVVGFVVHEKASGKNQTVVAATDPRLEKSIGVVPFLDLTEGMHEETFADGMTEELIDKFSKIQGLRVAAPTASFYFKDKQVPVADIAKALGVIYLLDGSVRKSGTRVRVSARLLRAENGFVVWSETYDRPFDDLIMVQDDIANEVTKALRASIEEKPAVRASQK